MLRVATVRAASAAPSVRTAAAVAVLRSAVAVATAAPAAQHCARRPLTTLSTNSALTRSVTRSHAIRQAYLDVQRRGFASCKNDHDMRMRAFLHAVNSLLLCLFRPFCQFPITLC
jgi:hypothetical protein